MLNDDPARAIGTTPAPEDTKKRRGNKLSINKEHLKDLSLSGKSAGALKGGVPKTITEECPTHTVGCKSVDCFTYAVGCTQK